MFRVIKTNSGQQLTELSLKQREQLFGYLAEKNRYESQNVTWRQFIHESKDKTLKRFRRGSTA